MKKKIIENFSMLSMTYNIVARVLTLNVTSFGGKDYTLKFEDVDDILTYHAGELIGSMKMPYCNVLYKLDTDVKIPLMNKQNKKVTFNYLLDHENGDGQPIYISASKVYLDSKKLDI